MCLGGAGVLFPFFFEVRTPEDLAAVMATIEMERPNDKISKFDGTLTVDGLAGEGGEPVPVGVDNVFLRGCTLRSVRRGAWRGGSASRDATVVVFI